jgi:hypothetical protein
LILRVGKDGWQLVAEGVGNFESSVSASSATTATFGCNHLRVSYD